MAQEVDAGLDDVRLARYYAADLSLVLGAAASAQHRFARWAPRTTASLGVAVSEVLAVRLGCREGSGPVTSCLIAQSGPRCQKWALLCGPARWLKLHGDERVRGYAVVVEGGAHTLTPTLINWYQIYGLPGKSTSSGARFPRCLWQRSLLP